MKKYDLVIREYDDNGNYIKDDYVIVNGKGFNNIYDIDEYTSSKKINSIWNDVLKDNNIRGFSSIMIRIVDGHDINYRDIIVNNKVINSCVKSVNDNGKISIGNDLLKKEIEDFLMYINIYDISILKEYLLDDNEELYKLVREYLKDRKDEYYDEIINKFSNYLVFRKWILNKDEIKRRGVYLNHLKDHYKDNEFVRKFNTEGGEFIFDDSKEEFLTDDELVDANVKIKKL